MNDNYGICDVCGFKFRVSKLLKRWDGAIVDRKCFEIRHPQDFPARAKVESQPKIMKAPKDIFLTSISGETVTILETITPDDLIVSLSPTTPTSPIFLNPGDVTSNDL